jgi:pimeloyl-ACP methyl ester carboxylesterase
MKSEPGPHGGYFVSPAETKYAETVVFVHQWGGRRSQLRPHMNFVAELGFRSFTFNQSFHSVDRVRLEPGLLPEAIKGLRHVWAHEIQEVLDQIEGRKILYSFSLPSGAALVALGRRKARDVTAWICDGGPFLHLHRCYWNYFTHQTPLKNPLLKEAAVLGSHFLFGAWNFKKDLRQAFAALPPEFPVLSIRGWQDPLVPVSAIEEVFELAKHKPEVLSLPEGHHIDGLKNCPEEYKSRVGRFLRARGSRVRADNFDVTSGEIQ